MKLWLIERTDEIGYEEYDSHVVRAETEIDARQLATDKSNTPIEPVGIWNSATTKVTEIKGDGPPEIIISSYTQG